MNTLAIYWTNDLGRAAHALAAQHRDPEVRSRANQMHGHVIGAVLEPHEVAFVQALRSRLDGRDALEAPFQKAWGETYDNAKRIDRERQIAARVVGDVLKAGHSISVNDGEGWAITRSTDAAAIKAALWSTDSDSLVIRTATGERLGFVSLVYGNDCDLISDHTDNPDIEALLSGAFALSERLAG